MKVEIKPHSWRDKGGRKYHADCYPFINGNPIPAVASCSNCKLQQKGDEEYCDGWKDNPEDAPLFCGPICPKFDLLESKRKLIEEVLGC